MSESIAKGVRKTLVNEIHRWQHEQIIQPELATRLLAMYSDTAGGGNVITILMTIGAVLIGLGAILFIASNWSILTALTKVSLIVAAVAGSYISGWYCKFEPGQRPKLGSSLLLLGALLFGAGIWLISQIYNLDTNLADGLLIWFLGVFPMALVTRSMSIGILTVLLSGCWAFCDNQLQVFSVGIDVQLLFQFTIAVAANLFTTSRLRSRWCLIATIVMASAWLVVNTSFLGLLSVGVALLAGYLWYAEKQPYLAPVYLMGGMLLTLFTLTGMTFEQLTGAALHVTQSLIIWLCSWAVLLTVFFKRKLFTAESSFLAVVLLAGPMTLADHFSLALALVSNGLLLAMLLGMMFVSANRHKSPMILNTAVAFLVLDIICRYFDLFFRTIDRSLFFVAGGFVFLIVATLLEQNRRKLLQGFSK